MRQTGPYRPPTRNQRVVQICAGAAGPRYAGTTKSGGTTTVLAYSGRESVPAARVRPKRSRDPSAPELQLTVLRADLLDVEYIQEQLKALAEREVEDERS